MTMSVEQIEQQKDDTSVSTDGFYIINCPYSISPNTKYTVVVCVLQAKTPCKMVLGLEGPGLDLPKQTVQLQPMSSKMIEFQIPELTPTTTDTDSYKLNAQGVEGLIFSESSELELHHIKPAVFVQTDRATYKPGDMVQFRVLALDEYLRPAETLGKNIAIYICDPERNRIKQYEVKALSCGVFSEKLQLSEYTILGHWSIVVYLDDFELCTKSFKVDQYVLPSFEVIVQAPKKVCITEERCLITVQAKYTYGQPVRGVAKVIIKPSRDYYYSEDDNDARKKYVVEKSVSIDGKTFVEFELSPYRTLDIYSSGVEIDVEANVSDELSGKEQRGVGTFCLVEKPFNIIVPSVRERFLQDSPAAMEKYPFIVKVTDLNDAPLLDKENSIRLLQEYRNRVIEGPLELKLNDVGEAMVELPWVPHEHYNIRVEYRNYVENGSMQIDVSKPEQWLTGVRVNPDGLTVGKSVDVEFKGDDVYDKFLYTVVSHGKIMKSELLDVGDRVAKLSSFRLDSTSEMIPNTQIFVQYISGNSCRSYKTKIGLPKEFANKIAIEAPEEAQPGDEVVLNIKADKDSFVGLLAIDQSVLLLSGGNDLDANEIWSRLEKRQYINDMSYFFSNTDNSISTLTNATPPVGEDDVDDEFRCRRLKKRKCAARVIKKVKGDTPCRVRKQFLETWFFDDLHASSNNLELKKILPDTITSWVVTGFAVHPRTGFALTKEATKIKTFRPFFIVTNLPYSIKRGEVVSIPIIVFNYSDEPVTTEVVLEANDEEFEPKGDLTSSLNIPAGGGETFNFIIRPKRVGHVTLKVIACSQRFSDAIEKELKVEPEGVTVYQNHDIFFDKKNDNSNESSLQKTLKLAIPDVIVPESEHIEVSVMGDILGSTITNLDKLVRMPCGCGEQNMVNFVPNILVLDYLISTNHLTRGIEESAKRHLNIGYQRELTYKHDDGSYSAFGKSDNSGSTWLTAYVVRSFLQASKYIDIDAKIIAEGVKFLHSKQEGNGSFREHGKLFDFTHLDEFGLTAFVLLALIDQQNSSEGDKDWSIVDKGLEYLKQNIDKCESSHAVSMAVYALNLRKPGSTEFLKKLDICLKSEGGHKWWTSFPKDDSKEVETKTECRRPWICVKPKNYDIEITSYALMSMLAANTETAQSLPTIKWLISKRNSNGGFSTTQDTVVGLQALIQFAMKINNSIGEFEISISDASSGVPCGNLQITPSNSLIVQTLELPREVREIKYDIKGDGSGLLQIAYRYNIADKTEGPAFELSVTSKLESVGLLKLSSMVKYLLNVPSNMVVMELSLPSGFKAMVEKFESIQSGGNVKRVETQNEDTKVIIYFESLTEGFNHTLDVYATRSHIVSEQKPSPVKLYDYYDQEKQATSFYDIST